VGGEENARAKVKSIEYRKTYKERRKSSETLTILQR